MEALKLEPLAGPDLPPAVAALAAGATPAKLMAARGMAPLRPAEMVMVVYQLSFDGDARRAEARPRRGRPACPTRSCSARWASRCRRPCCTSSPNGCRSSAARRSSRCCSTTSTSDETFVHLAGRLDESGLEIIFQNEVRLLRCPAIVEALYFNKQARMSSVTRALELCVRNHVRPEGIPGFDELAAALMADPNAVVPSAPDEVFASAVTASEAEVSGRAVGPMLLDSEESEDGALEEDTGGETAGDDKGNAGSAFIKWDELKIFEKVRLATVGNQYCRQVLIRDTNKVVAMAVVRSPSITDGEIVAAAGNRGVCDDVIRYIANSRVYVKDYAVKQALVNNPKCPLGMSLRLLSFLHPEDLRAIARSKNVPGALATAAKKLAQTRNRSG